MDQINELKNTFLELYGSAELLIKQNRYKSAVILFSKALFALLDYNIFLKYNKVPKNHSDRFRILESRQPVLYGIVDNVWKEYTDTYSKPTDKEAVLMLKNAIMEVIRKDEKLSEKFKEIIK